MIKILHFITDTNIGGAGNLLCQQIKGLEKGKFEFSVALPKGSALIHKLSPLPCKIIELQHGADRSFSLQSIIENYEIIRKVRPDIVHSHGSLSSRIAATILKIPCRVFTRHCAPPIPKLMKNPLAKWIYGSVNNALSTSIIATAECARHFLISMGCDAQKIVTVVNGASPLRHLDYCEKAFLCARYGLDEKNFIVSILARLEKGKGHKTLLEAAKICKKECPNFRFFIVGTGSTEQYLRELAQKLNVCDTVHFVGFQNDVASILGITDVNVNCSYLSETSSLSLSEGMSIGVPCVASDVGGNPYMVKNEENGLIFPSRNPRALADALIRLYRDNELYKKCSRGALERYRQELNSKTMCRKMTTFYLREYQKSKNPTRITKIRSRG